MMASQVYRYCENVYQASLTIIRYPVVAQSLCESARLYYVAETAGGATV